MKFGKQLDQMDCRPICLKMVLQHYNIQVSINKLSETKTLGPTPTVNSIFQ